MSGKKLPRLFGERGGALLKRSAAPTVPFDAPPLVDLLWRRRRTIATVVGLCLTVTVVYLLFAARVYRAESRLFVEQNGPRVYSEGRTDSPRTDSFLYTQVQTLDSGPVLRYALDQAGGPRQLKTFSHVSGDPIEWLQRGTDLKMEVGKKDDAITVSMESPYPQEAVAIVKGVIDGYLVRLGRQRRVTGEQMVQILTAEREQLEREREAGITALVQFKALHGAVTFRDEKGNITLERLASLSTALTTAELASLDVRVRHAAAQAVMQSQEAMAAFVEAQQMKGRDFGDREYDDLRSQLSQYTINLRTNLEVLGPNHVRSRAMQSAIDLLQAKVAQKERAIANAHLIELTVQRTAAENAVKQIRESLESQRQAALALNPKAAEYARLENDVERLQKQCDVIDSRIQEVSVNNLGGGALNVEVFDPAHVGERPIRPQKLLSLVISLLAGTLLGIGLVMAQEWRDKRLRTPEEIAGYFEIPTIGIVPRMRPQLSVAERGQIVQGDPMSEVAEAYRAVRTTLHFGTPDEGRTFLVTSPTSGEGKSTCSSNLAIALAQAGHRTLLIDCDLRRPVQHRIFRTPGGIGITDVMTGRAKLRDAIRPTGIDGLFLLPCGTLPGKPAEMLESKRFAQVMQALAAAFDRIVIDSSPVAPVTDARILAASADATLLVFRMHWSTRALGTLALDSLQKVGARVIGAIANEVATADGYGYYRNAPPARPKGGRVAERLRAADAAARDNGREARKLQPALSVDPPPMPAEIMAISDPESPADSRWVEPVQS